MGSSGALRRAALAPRSQKVEKDIPIEKHGENESKTSAQRPARTAIAYTNLSRDNRPPLHFYAVVLTRTERLLEESALI